MKPFWRSNLSIFIRKLCFCRVDPLGFTRFIVGYMARRRCDFHPCGILFWFATFRAGPLCLILKLLLVGKLGGMATLLDCRIEFVLMSLVRLARRLGLEIFCYRFEHFLLLKKSYKKP